MLMEGFQLGTKQERIACPAVIHRLLSEPIAGQSERAFATVPDGETEHAVETLDRFADAPLLEGGEHDFRVRMAAETMTVLVQICADLLEVVDLAVEHHHEGTAFAVHRLVPFSGKVN